MIDTIALVKPASIAKTSSGKIQRYACRDDYMNGQLNALYIEDRKIAPTTPVVESHAGTRAEAVTTDTLQAWLRQWLGHKINQPVDALSPDRSLSEYGLDSLIVIDLHHAIEATFDLRVPVETFFENISLNALAVRCCQQVAADAEVSAKIEPVSPWETYWRQQYDASEPPQAERMTFSQPNDPPWKHRLVSVVERLAGVRRLETLFEQTLATRDQYSTLWEAGLAQLHMTLDYDPNPLERVPRDGGVIFIANHAYGVVDALALCHLVETTRGPFRALAGTQLAFAEAIASYFLPIPFANTPEAWQVKGQTIQCVLETLNQNGTMVIFPAGMIATSQGFFGPAEDHDWSHFTAHIVNATQATVVPVYFHGQNSRLFQVVSHLSLMARRGLLFRQTLNQIGSTLSLNIGEPIAYDQLSHLDNEKALTAYLRRATYALSYTFEGHKLSFKKDNFACRMRCWFTPITP